MKHLLFLILWSICLQAQTWTEYTVATTSNTIPTEEARFEITDIHQRLWLGTLNGLFYKDLHSNQVFHYELGNTDIDAIFNMFLDSDSNLCVLTPKGQYFIQDGIQTEYLNSDFHIPLAYSEYKEMIKSGDFVLLSEKRFQDPTQKVFLYNGTLWDTLHFNAPAKLVYQDIETGNFLFQTQNSIIRYHQGNLEYTATSFQEYPNLKIRLKDSQGNIWLNMYENLYTYKEGVLTDYSSATSSQWLSSNIAEMPDGTIAMILSNSKIALFKNNNWSFIPKAFTPNEKFVFCYQQKLHINDYGTLYQINASNEVSVITTQVGFMFNTSAEDIFGNLFVCHLPNPTNGIYRLRQQQWEKTNESWAISALRLDKNKHVQVEYTLYDPISYYEEISYIHSTQQYKASYDGIKWTSQSFPKKIEPSELKSNQVFELEMDNLGFTWIAGPKGISLQQSNSDWQTIAYDSTRMPFVFYDMTISEEQEIWLGTSKGLMKYDGTSWINWDKSDGLGSDTITQVLLDKTNRIWLATYNGISLFNGSQFTNFDTIAPLFCNPKTPRDGYDPNYIAVYQKLFYKPLACNAQNKIYAINGHNLYWYTQNTWHSRAYLDPFFLEKWSQDPYHLELLVDKHDSVWINRGYYGQGCCNGGIHSGTVYLGNGTLQELTTNEYDGYLPVKIDKNGIRWRLWRNENHEHYFVSATGTSIKYDVQLQLFPYFPPYYYVYSEDILWLISNTFPMSFESLDEARMFKYDGNGILSNQDAIEDILLNPLVYPIPTDKELTFSIDFRSATIEILNTLGQTVRSMSVSENNTVDVSDLSSGVYIFKINKDENTELIRIIKK